MRRPAILSLAGLLALGACRVEVGPPGGQRTAEACGEAPSGSVLIYSSMYRQVIDAITPVLAARLPEVKVQWLQGGSEKLATRLDAELAAGAPRADLVLTSDPLWYERLAREGHLLPHAALPALSLPRELVHPGGAYVTSRLSTMVLAWNTRAVAPGDAPRRFEDLLEPRWRGRVTMADPLGSGTAFTALAFLDAAASSPLIPRLREAKVIASGGNTAAVSRLEAGEHALGLVLLENVLEAQARGAPLAFAVPEEGAILIPGPVAILAKTRNPGAARAVYDLLLSAEVQALIVAGGMHSPFEAVPPPPGTPPLSALLETRHRWTAEFKDRTLASAAALRARFAEVMGE